MNNGDHGVRRTRIFVRMKNGRLKQHFTQATIKAEPNPAPVTEGKFGKTTITWDTGDGTAGDVMLSHEGGDEKPFAKNRVKGSQEAAWIGKGVYEFRLYVGTDRTKPRAIVRVTRATK